MTAIVATTASRKTSTWIVAIIPTGPTFRHLSRRRRSGNDPKSNFVIHRTFDHITAFSTLLEMRVHVRAFQKTRGGV
jgi:hypothetical protein